MKSLIRRTVSTSICLLVIVHIAASQAVEKISVPLTRPGKAYDLRLQLPEGTIEMSSYDGTSIEIEAVPEKPKTPAQGNQNKNHNTNINLAAKKIQEVVIIDRKYISVTESGNIITVKPVDQGQFLSIKVRVPRAKSVFRITSSLRADIGIRDVSGELDITNNAGQIKLANISGSAVVSNLAGDISATFKTISPNTPMAFSTLAGVIDVSVPANAKANIKAHSDSSPFISDFETDYTSTPVPKISTTKQGSYQITNAKNLVGRIGGGGPEIRFKTMVGTIYLRKSK